MTAFRMRYSGGDKVAKGHVGPVSRQWMRVSFLLPCLIVWQGATETHPQVKDKMDGKALAYVLAKRGCTQEDAPALEIYFSRTKFNGTGEPEPPYLRFEISSSSRDPVTPGTYVLSGLRKEPGKARRIVRGEFVEMGYGGIWVNGTIVLDEVSPSREVKGRYDVTSPSGLHLSKSFLTEYLSGAAMCG